MALPTAIRSGSPPMKAYVPKNGRAGESSGSVGVAEVGGGGTGLATRVAQATCVAAITSDARIESRRMFGSLRGGFRRVIESHDDTTTSGLADGFFRRPLGSMDADWRATASVRIAPCSDLDAAILLLRAMAG